MTIGIRSVSYGSSVLMIEDRKVEKIGAKFGYTTWHPSGKVVAYSINGVSQFFHAMGDETRDVIDMNSLLAYYLVESKKIKTVEQLSRKDRLETYPAWSPDGRYLYFSSAPILWSDQKKVPPDRYKEVKYDIVRVSYDIEKDKWGQIETVVSAKGTGLSCLEPRISPDGRWLLFVMCDYGCFPVYQKSSDLYLVDLKAAEQTGKFDYRRLDINSDESESWHSFSSNSRWMVFSSKRDYGVFTRSYISYIDDSGKVYKPFILPQKDPYFYDSYTKTFSVPELIAEPVRIRKERLGKVVRSSKKVAVEMPITMATRKAGEPIDGEAPWLGGRE
jgi:Tol biopolymer transport system component